MQLNQRSSSLITMSYKPSTSDVNCLQLSIAEWLCMTDMSTPRFAVQPYTPVHRNEVTPDSHCNSHKALCCGRFPSRMSSFWTRTCCFAVPFCRRSCASVPITRLQQRAHQQPLCHARVTMTSSSGSADDEHITAWSSESTVRNDDFAPDTEAAQLGQSCLLKMIMKSTRMSHATSCPPSRLQGNRASCGGKPPAVLCAVAAALRPEHCDNARGGLMRSSPVIRCWTAPHAMTTDVPTEAA